MLFETAHCRPALVLETDPGSCCCMLSECHVDRELRGQVGDAKASPGHEGEDCELLQVNEFIRFTAIEIHSNHHPGGRRVNMASEGHWSTGQELPMAGLCLIPSIAPRREPAHSSPCFSISLRSTARDFCLSVPIPLNCVGYIRPKQRPTNTVTAAATLGFLSQKE